MIYSQTQIYLFSAIQFVAPLVTMIGLYAKIIATVKEKVNVYPTNAVSSQLNIKWEIPPSLNFAILCSIEIHITLRTE